MGSAVADVSQPLDDGKRRAAAEARGRRAEGRAGSAEAGAGWGKSEWRRVELGFGGVRAGRGGRWRSPSGGVAGMGLGEGVPGQGQVAGVARGGS